jgi:hypothetical protein
VLKDIGFAYKEIEQLFSAYSDELYIDGYDRERFYDRRSTSQIMTDIVNMIDTIVNHELAISNK